MSCRWQQQHRTCTGIRNRLDPWVSDGARPRLAQVFHLDEVRHAQASDIHRCDIIAVAVVPTGRTTEPASPFHGLGPIRRLAIGGRWFAAVGAGMRRATWLLYMKAQANEMALIAQQTPDFPPDRRVVAIVAPASSHSLPAPGGLEGFQRLHGKQRTAMDATQQQQDIAGQMSEFSITLFVFTPAK